MPGQNPLSASEAQSAGGTETTRRASNLSPAAARVRRLFVAATVVDAIGSGLWMPFALLFLVHGQGMPLTDVGAALSLGGLIGLATGPAVGMVMDRIGPLPVLVISNVIRLVAFCCYPLVSSIWEVTLVSAVVGIGDRLFWTANAPFINAVTTGRDAERVLGTQTIGRFLGAGIGAGGTALLPTTRSPFICSPTSTRPASASPRCSSKL